MIKSIYLRKMRFCVTCNRSMQENRHAHYHLVHQRGLENSGQRANPGLDFVTTWGAEVGPHSPINNWPKIWERKNWRPLQESREELFRQNRVDAAQNFHTPQPIEKKKVEELIALLTTGDYDLADAAALALDDVKQWIAHDWNEQGFRVVPQVQQDDED